MIDRAQAQIDAVKCWVALQLVFHIVQQHCFTSEARAKQRAIGAFEHAFDHLLCSALIMLKHKGRIMCVAESNHNPSCFTFVIRWSTW